MPSRSPTRSVTASIEVSGLIEFSPDREPGQGGRVHSSSSPARAGIVASSTNSSSIWLTVQLSVSPAGITRR